MNKKDAAALLATQAPGYKNKKSLNRIDSKQRTNREIVSHATNCKEDALIDAIDQKHFLMKHAEWISKLQSGKVDVPQFISAVAPDVALEILRIALDGKSDKARLAAAQDLLDRAGYSKVTKIAAAIVDPNAPKAQLIAMIEGLTRKTGAIEIIDDSTEKK